MAWMTMTDAASALSCSERTLRRKIKAGELESKPDGRRLLVNVATDKAMATVSGIGRQLAEVEAASAIQRRADSDIMSAITSSFDHASERAERAERRALSAVRWCVAALAVGSIAVVCAAGWGGWTFHRTVLDHAAAVTGLERTHAETVAELNTAAAVLTAERDRLAESVKLATADATSAGEQARTLQAERDKLAAKVDALRVVLGARETVRNVWQALTTPPEPFVGPPADQLATLTP